MFLAGAALAAGLFAVAPGASAQGVMIGPDGVQIVPPGFDRGPPPPPPRGYDRDQQRYGENDEIGPREARRIARSAGMAQTYDVGRRGGVWIVRGEDRRGRDLRVVISARSGEVVNVDRRG
ncbi:hypothetical protein C3941_04505 [Kaistia algarum]|nr:hypothetical protein C3941_04505 [Kaistia algarum]